ncbi:hypothetical protein F5Y10DRAFT_284022 [Nemania abortiva]|nr:hypothetical protein F5Y10DRAFT_284022 [Nemania abortiva]
MAIDSDDDYRESGSEHETPRQPLHNPRNVLPIRPHTPIHRKRRAKGFTGPPPLKRKKGEFNAGYLSLLNQDIHDASSSSLGFTHGEGGDLESESELELELKKHTQIGAVVWSAAEKNALFAAVGRLGRDDAAGLAARIGTKSEVEVRQYLALLLDATESRRHGHGRGGGEGKAVQRPLRPVDVPAAVEISAECAAALETTADALSLRQEGYEEEVEKERWGSRWLVTAPLARIFENSSQGQQRAYSETSAAQPQSRDIGRDEEDDSERPLQPGEEERGEKDKPPDELPFLQFFHMQNWLQLSDRIFMNSAVSDSNWHAVSEEHEPPAIRATALADFHALVLSITRRLLFAAIYVAESRVRIRSLNDARKRGNPRVRVEDVAAAVSSLGMKHGSRKFWAQCARRLRLDVVDDTAGEYDFTDLEDEDTPTDESEDTDRDSHPSPKNAEAEQAAEEDEEEEEDPEVMSYDEVEAALGFPTVDNMRTRLSTSEAYVSTASEYISSASEEATDEEEQEEYLEEYDEYEEDVEMKDQVDTHGESDDGLNPIAIRNDIEEAMTSWVPIEDTGTDVATSARQSLKSRIHAEHRLERDAERLDMKASADAESTLWAVLRGHSDSQVKGHKI